MENDTIDKALDDESCEGPCAPSNVDLASFQGALRAIAGKWKTEIICALLDGPRRFGDLRRSLPGITQHMLTAQLRELESSGLLVRTAYAEIPPRVEYELTEAAYALQPVFEAMLAWSQRYGGVLAAARKAATGRA